MPVGSELREAIQNRAHFKFDGRIGEMWGDHHLYACLREKYNQGSELKPRLEALAQIHKGIHLASSIDSFIETHSHNPLISEVGKLLIAASISEAESVSDLFYPTDNIRDMLDLKNPRISKTWLESFARILIDKTQRQNIENIATGISIICFNYDRCIEFYLIEAIRQTMNVSYGDAHTLVMSMNIIHPYGSLGMLPTRLNGPQDKNAVPFGHRLENGLDLWPITDQIKTYTEQVSDKATMTTIWDAVNKAKQIVFLGFGFHSQNMRLLTRPQFGPRFSYKKIYATGVGVSSQEIPEVSRRITEMCYGKAEEDEYWKKFVNIDPGMSCAELLQKHGRNLSEA